jgi:hypothetical protein
MSDWYPRNAGLRLVWHRNWVLKLQDQFAAKYDVSAATLAQAVADLEWMNYWHPKRFLSELYKQQLTKFYNEIAGNDPTLVAPQNPVPPEVDPMIAVPPPGIEHRTREIARQIKGHIRYSVADGEALGIVTATAERQIEVEMTPEFNARTLANFELEVVFSRKGTDALKFQFRNKGGAWQNASVLLSSPGTIRIPPQEPGVAQQIELRAIFMRKNSEIGNYSDAKTAFIAG